MFVLFLPLFLKTIASNLYKEQQSRSKNKKLKIKKSLQQQQKQQQLSIKILASWIIIFSSGY